MDKLAASGLTQRHGDESYVTCRQYFCKYAYTVTSVIGLIGVTSVCPRENDNPNMRITTEHRHAQVLPSSTPRLRFLFKIHSVIYPECRRSLARLARLSCAIGIASVPLAWPACKSAPFGGGIGGEVPGAHIGPRETWITNGQNGTSKSLKSCAETTMHLMSASPEPNTPNPDARPSWTRGGRKWCATPFTDC